MSFDQTSQSFSCLLTFLFGITHGHMIAKTNNRRTNPIIIALNFSGVKLINFTLPKKDHRLFFLQFLTEESTGHPIGLIRLKFSLICAFQTSRPRASQC